MSSGKELDAEIHMHYPPTEQDDDFIDLFGLVETVWQQKWLVIAITTLTGAIAVAAITWMTPSYQAEVHLRPPLASQIADINSSSLIQITNEAALYRVADELRSLATQRTVFEVVKNDFSQEPPEDQDNWDIIFADKFTQNISVNIGRVDVRKGAFDIYANLAFKHWNPEFVAATTNALADQSLEDARLAIVNEVKGIATSKLNALNARLQQQLILQQTISQDEISRLGEEDQFKKLELLDRINGVKDTANIEAEDEIRRLEESHSIAKQLGIKEPTSMRLLSQQGSGSNASVAVSTDVSESSEPNYMRGTRALEAEFDALRARDSNDFATPELRGLQEQLRLLDNNRRSEQLAARKDFGPYVAGITAIRTEMAQLEGILAQSYDDLVLARIDQRAIAPAQPESPRKVMTLALALILGGFLGCAIALIRNAVANRRAGQQSELMPPPGE
ncbi:MAG: chain length determinant protein (polysaccharide antigen chain regulator) [Halieaceae bacterium]|jgi:chain length determinant protein (polysaccharide antigen chain regulator)